MQGCIQTNFGRYGFFSFGDFACFSFPFKTGNLPFLTMDYSPWSSRNLIDQNWLKKFMHVGVDVTCMCTDFGGRGYSSFRDTATLKNGQISLSDHGL